MILKLILENYIPHISSGIHRVELDTNHFINLFISASGSGKSAILKELNPWPAENGDYKNGRKYIELIHNNRLFILESRTHLGNGHSFKLFDGKDPNGAFVEYNGGGTFSVQKELVEAHFEIDNGLIRVAHGIRMLDRMSAMPISRRKDIFMKVYPNDTRYALGVYYKLKTERNDLKSAIKKQIERHAEENRKLTHIQEFGEEELDRQIKAIEHELKQALLMRGQLESAKIDPSVQDKVTRFNRLVDQLTVNRVSNFIFTQDELEDSLSIQQSLLSTYKEQASVIQRMISENASHLEGLDEFLKDPEKFKGQAEMLAMDVAENEVKLSQFNGKLNTLPIFQDTELDFSGLIDVIPQFNSYLQRVTLVSDPTLLGGTFKGYQVTLEKTQAKQRELAVELTEINHRIRHITGMEDINCPECKHTFKLGVKADDLSTLNQKKVAVQGYLSRLEEEEKALSSKVNNDIDWFMSMNQLFTFIRENGHVKVLAELVKAYDIGKTIHTPLSNALEAFVGRSKVEAYLTTLNNEKAIIDARMELLHRNNVLDVAIYVSSLEDELFKENTLIAKTGKKIEALHRQIKTITTHKSDVDSLRQLAIEIEKGMNSNDSVKFRDIVDNRIVQMTTDKEHKLATVIKNRSLVAVVNSISEDIGNLKRRLVIVETWMDGLCPNKGKIGKMMTDFIAVVCANVNAVLQNIWDTPLYVLPCSKENGDLTYKFPVVKELGGDPAPDISDGSAGEAEAIDWAFRYVLMNYLPDDLPLIMDEVGINFDEIKRARFLNFILGITQQDNPRQMFMVSHYAGVTGSFVKPNIIALKYDGLTLPGIPNEHTKVA